MRIGFVTSSSYPDLTPDDLLAIPTLAEQSIEVEPVVWTGPDARWRGLDGMVLRSTWDYHLNPTGFLDWIGRVEASGIPLWNPPAILRWNLDKRYLRAIEAWGVPIPGTVWVDRGATTTVAAAVASLDTEDAVIKPVIGGGSYGVIRIGHTGPDRAEVHLQEILATGAAMIQAFAPEIETVGEWSLMFLGGQYSHAVIKRPATGDFRVQDEVGGSHASAVAPAAIIQQAARLLGLLRGPLLYARVDGYLKNDQLVVMELELLEPTLFLARDPEAPGRFASAIRRMLAGPRRTDYTLTP